ncbi:tyrosine-protein phosphatase non-receptor type substrate 1-like [Pimephales promelas]|uniref:tyrosine-protein phosphatase non-receptor type substrate 1-like n=1 Tax=Pimephales promelas TaxID=90988 RepID=UPI001955B016|nr:tyrosine-protein phosphatase non-receptor type substrate 1-like [Pimephales promelas]
MSDQCDLCLLGLIILSSLLTGTSGVDDDHVFISSGVDVRLPCNNALSDCKSTTWNYYNKFRHSSAVELIAGGIKKNDTERHERLSLESDCSLNIKNVTEEDCGSYSCRQYVNGTQQGSDTRVYLHVLRESVICVLCSVSVSPSSSSSSSSQTEISPGRSVTLSCQLNSGFSCNHWVHYERVELLWVNQAGVDLKTHSRYQISSSSSSSSSSDRCIIIITLTTTLLNEDNNREWRCQLTHRNQLQTSVTYTVKYSAQADTPITGTNSQDNLTTITVIGISVAAVAVLLLALLWLICRKTAGNKRGTGDSAVKDENEDKGTYETINMSIPPAARADEQTDDVTYSEVTSSNTKPVKALDDHNDTVTYAAIRGREDKPQDQLYATVNNNK